MADAAPRDTELASPPPEAAPAHEPDRPVTVVVLVFVAVLALVTAFLLTR